MKEYIEREKTLALIHDIGGCGAQPDTRADGYDKGVDCAYGIVMIMPTADAVEVVRCKDCKHSREKDKNETFMYCEDVIICTSGEATVDGWLPVFENHYCSYGERRAGE